MELEIENTLQQLQACVSLMPATPSEKLLRQRAILLDYIAGMRNVAHRSKSAPWVLGDKGCLPTLPPGISYELQTAWPLEVDLAPQKWVPTATLAKTESSGPIAEAVPVAGSVPFRKAANVALAASRWRSKARRQSVQGARQRRAQLASVPDPAGGFIYPRVSVEAPGWTPPPAYPAGDVVGQAQVRAAAAAQHAAADEARIRYFGAVDQLDQLRSIREAKAAALQQAATLEADAVQRERNGAEREWGQAHLEREHERSGQEAARRERERQRHERDRREETEEWEDRWAREERERELTRERAREAEAAAAVQEAGPARVLQEPQRQRQCSKTAELVRVPLLMRAAALTWVYDCMQLGGGAVTQLFAKLDADGDGVITPDELRAGLGGPLAQTCGEPTTSAPDRPRTARGSKAARDIVPPPRPKSARGGTSRRAERPRGKFHWVEALWVAFGQFVAMLEDSQALKSAVLGLSSYELRAHFQFLFRKERPLAEHSATQATSLIDSCNAGGAVVD